MTFGSMLRSPGPILALAARSALPVLAAALLLPDTAGAEDPRPARFCSSCHQMQNKEWQTSSMAKAWTNPVFQAFLEDAKKDLGPGIQTDCVACHAPLGFVTGDLKMEDPKSREGVTCNFCHNVSEVEVSPRPASYTWDASDPLLMRGPYKDADPAAAHGTVYSELFTKSDFCSSCHWYDREPGVPIEATHVQWKASKAAASGLQCQSCHMKPSRGKAALIAKKTRDQVWSHAFPGAHGDSLPDSVAAVAGAVEGGRLKLTVTNRQGGHSLPGGGGSFRWIALEVVYRDGAGKEMARVPVQGYGTVFADAAGKSPVPKWNAKKVARSAEIPADDPRIEWADIPAGARRAEAILTYHFLHPSYVPALEARKVDLSLHRPRVLARTVVEIP
ncbi:MAG TPA: multiheme c-type cytochrome [Candidatus Eisenbacteria bacterium]|nr:multiheme c-type cytochrome [Candidatus Eisenbacteria bacterium]